MADVVDKVLGQASSPGPNQANSEPGGEPGAPTGSSGGELTPRAESRIRELVAEREEIKARHFEEVGQLKQQLDDVKARLESIDSQKGGDDRPITSWSDLSDSQLRTAMKESVDNPEMQAAAMEELIRREAGKQISEFEKTHKTEQAKDSYRQQVYQQITQDFGEDARNKSSDLFKRADSHYANLRAAYRQMHGVEAGDRMLASNPEAEYACFAKAYTELLAPQRDELNRLRGEVERFKQVGSMEIGRAAGVKPPDSVTDALKSGDWRKAVKNLPILPT